jgi:hypothetical protein
MVSVFKRGIGIDLVFWGVLMIIFEPMGEGRKQSTHGGIKTAHISIGNSNEKARWEKCSKYGE